MPRQGTAAFSSSRVKKGGLSASDIRGKFFEIPINLSQMNSIFMNKV